MSPLRKNQTIMKPARLLAAASLFISAVMAASAVAAQEAALVELPKPRTEGGKPLMEVLKKRGSSRAFRQEEIPPQVLSNLLWAAFGVNRPESGGRTAPSAHNWQEIEIYVATAEALYLFDAGTHSVKTVLSGDVRALTGLQSFVAKAPVDLIYVADRRRMREAGEAERDFYSAADAGFISQNVYLFCASEGLTTVVRGSIDRTALAVAMRLHPQQRVILSQTVGYPE